MDWLIGILREYPTLALFLTVGAGFFFGKLKFGNFQLGSVTSVLIIGVLVGQLNIPMSGPLKMVFFMMFLFSIGYSVGPDFFRSLKGTGAKQALFAVVMSSVIFAVVLVTAKIMAYSKGETVGLFSGAETCSALLGVGSEALAKSTLPPDEIKQQINIIPVCYAVTYIFGTFGTVVLLGNFGPKLLGGMEKVRQKTIELEKQMNNDRYKNDPAYENALKKIDYRSYIASSNLFVTPRTVRDIELYLREQGIEVYIDRISHEDRIFAPRHDNLIYEGDEIVVCGNSKYLMRVDQYIGHETSNERLLTYPLERLTVIVTKDSFIDKTIEQLRSLHYMHGIVIRDAERKGSAIDINLRTKFKKGDKLTLLGRPTNVSKGARHIGHADRPTNSSDLMFVGLAIFIGGLFGAISIWVGSIPVSFGTSGGALVAGLVFGWWRSKRPSFGNISPGALWLMNNLGLNVFIAVVGIEAAPSFVAGIKAVGPMLFVAGAVATVIPLLVGLWLGHKVFKFNPAITLGCCAGTRTSTASLGAVQDAIGSTVPAIGYAVTYAVSNILLVIWGLLVVLLI